MEPLQAISSSLPLGAMGTPLLAFETAIILSAALDAMPCLTAQGEFCSSTAVKADGTSLKR